MLFARVAERQAGPLRLHVPDWTSFDWRAGVLTALALLLIFRWKWNVIAVLGLSALLGLALARL